MKTILALLTVGAFAVGSALACDWHDPVPASVQKIIDGDTIVIDNGEHIRLLSIDTPETWKPHCDRELDVGMQAYDRLTELLSVGNITVKRTGVDRYGRTLGIVYADGRDVSQTLLSEGLALQYQPGGSAKLARLQHWCPGAQLDY